MEKKPSYPGFDKGSYAWQSDVDHRKHPELYKVGKGEQGVLICEPYKAEIGQFWRFKTGALAKESSQAIYKKFLCYLGDDDFVGGDMARKYLQISHTRARRYANYKGGKNDDKGKGYRSLEKGTGEDEKARAAAVFYDAWKLAEGNENYSAKKASWKKENG